MLRSRLESLMTLQFRHLAPIMDRTSGKLIGCLKFVKDGAKEGEIEILQYFAALRSEFNHSVRPFAIWSVTGGSIIAMPAAGDSLTSLTDLDARLWSLTIQLFEGVQFMHDHNVAHMDLKPDNILVPSTYGRLTIVDFGLSVRLRNKAELLQGRAGTEGYIAPEVGNTKFSPIRADLWSVGKVVKELCMLCRPSASRDRLSSVSELLLNDDPSKRPMMSEVLGWMLNRDASETQPSGHLRYLVTPIFFVQLSESLYSSFTSMSPRPPPSESEGMFGNQDDLSKEEEVNHDSVSSRRLKLKSSLVRVDYILNNTRPFPYYLLITSSTLTSLIQDVDRHRGRISSVTSNHTIDQTIGVGNGGSKRGRIRALIENMYDWALGRG
jgi:serine/threonine protein kinase